MRFLSIILICAHFTGDWFFQWPAMSQHASKKITVLLLHVLIVSTTLVIYLGPILGVSFWLFKMVGINAFFHGVIDWNIWRIYARYFSHDVKGNIVNPTQNVWFWKFIAVDQLLHLVILVSLFL